MSRSLPSRLALAAIALAAAAAAQAQVAIFDNTTSFSGQALPNGGAANLAGNTITRLVADQIQTTQIGSPLAITGFSFSVANLDAANVTARPRVRFYAADGVGGAPGTYLTGFSFTPITFNAGQVGLFSSTAAFTLNVTNGLFWAGITFDDNTGTTGATLAQLNNLGQGLYDPPTVGSSADGYFVTTAAGSFLSNNPAGTQTTLGGSPVANFGWRFTVATPIPEAGTLWMSLLGLPLLGAVVMRRRQASA